MLSRRVWRRFVRGSREIPLVPSLHRASTDALIKKFFLPCVVPSAAPGFISVTSGVDSILVKWDSVDCIHANGAITYYSLKYRVVGSNTETSNMTKVMVKEANITELCPSTNYSIQVAAINSAGTGL